MVAHSKDCKLINIYDYQDLKGIQIPDQNFIKCRMINIIDKFISKDFKLAVVEDFNNLLRVRTIILKYNLQFKNYITMWEEYLKSEGLLFPGAIKVNKSVGRFKEVIVCENIRALST